MCFILDDVKSQQRWCPRFEQLPRQQRTATLSLVEDFHKATGGSVSGLVAKHKENIMGRTLHMCNQFPYAAYVWIMCSFILEILDNHVMCDFSCVHDSKVSLNVIHDMRKQKHVLFIEYVGD